MKNAHSNAAKAKNAAAAPMAIPIIPSWLMLAFVLDAPTLVGDGEGLVLFVVPMLVVEVVPEV